MSNFKDSGHCSCCKKKTIEIIRSVETKTLDEEDLSMKETKTTCRICDNPKCTLYTNIKKIKSWERRS